MKPGSLLVAVLWGTLLVRPAAAGAPVAENYTKNCAGCHGADGRAQTRLGRKTGAKDLTDRDGAGRRSVAELIAIIRDGRKDPDGTERMEPFGERFTAPEIAELAAYVRRLARPAAAPGGDL
jgi:mono/diheme cytochrome c family protein